MCATTAATMLLVRQTFLPKMKEMLDILCLRHAKLLVVFFLLHLKIDTNKEYCMLCCILYVVKVLRSKDVL